MLRMAAMHTRALVHRSALAGRSARGVAGSAARPAPVTAAVPAAPPRASARVAFSGARLGPAPLSVRRAPPCPASAGRARLLVTAAKGGEGDAAKAQGGGKKKGRGKKEANVYGHTVLLPETAFDMRANSTTKEPAMQAWWAENGVYEEIANREDVPTFTLHDGPPYANGDLHIGHALNKILKDFVNRYEALEGKRVRYVPGWDCHGLPIELKVLQSMDADKRRELSPIKLRKKAAAFARKTVDAQREQFKRYGVFADWEDPYLTLLPEYEAAQMEVFGAMFLNGHVYRGKKPVHWSPSSMTALAEAELEYPEGHVSQSVYVAFPVKTADACSATDEEKALLADASLAVWTTTPWTMPANAAVAVNDQLDYAVVKVVGSAAEEDGSGSGPAPDAARFVGRTLVVAEGLVADAARKWGVELETLCVVKGGALEGVTYGHPMYDRVSPVVVGGDYITTETGTGLVHTAPGHGQEDYATGLKFDLPLLSPVDDAGDFTEEAGEALAGKNVLGDGNEACISALRETGGLILQEAYEHKYPYDWRTKKPTIFRATSQWFASVEGFRDDALAALDGIEFIPASGSKRMRPMVSGRNDWCISRQRAWGVPIPCFYDVDTGEALMDASTIEHVTEIVREKGTDAWWESPIEDLLPAEHKAKAASLTKGTDTMDVWFDSGSSWNGVVKQRGLNYPADVYLEGSDQHRGWFQSSLLTSVAANGVAPYKTILTHGFVLDEKGHKMSKSLGNVVDPRLVIEGGKNLKQEPAYGADTLRLWVASADYASDVLIGGNVLKQTSDAYRKLRGTLRFLMGNVGDFDPKTDAVPFDELPAFDKYVLSRTAAFASEARDAYAKHAYASAVAATQNFVAFLSNVFLDVSKDRLYVDAPTSKTRRAAQTVIHEVLSRYLAAIAPITPHTAEEAHLAMPEAIKAGRARSVFLHGWPETPEAWTSGTDEETRFWKMALGVRSEVNKAIEAARGEKTIGASLEAEARVYIADETARAAFRARVAELVPFFIVSELAFVDAEEEAAPAGSGASAVRVAGAEAVSLGLTDAGASVGVRKTAGVKCARCWGYHDASAMGSDEKHPELCPRCTEVVVAVDPTMDARAIKAEMEAKAKAEAEAAAVEAV